MTDWVRDCSTELRIKRCGSDLYVRVFFFQAEDGIRDLVRSRGLGDVYKRQGACRRQAVASLLRHPGHDRVLTPQGLEIPQALLELSLIHI